MKTITGFDGGGDAILLTSPIKFTNLVNLNFYYGPYGWKDDDGTIHRYFIYKKGRISYRYPSVDNKNIRPSGMTEEECFEDDGEGNLIYKSSVAYGYALACIYLGKASDASVGTTFGVADNDDNIIEYIFDGIDNEEVPSAHIKLDKEEIVEETKNAVQTIIPKAVDEHGDPVTNLNDFVSSQLLDYAKTSEVFDGNEFRISKIPSAIARTEALGQYAKTSEITDFVKNEKLNEYTPKIDLFEDGKIRLDKIPSTIVRDSDIFSGNEIIASKLPQIPDNKMPSGYVKDEALVNYAQTSELTKFAEKNDLFEDNKIKLSKIPQLTDTQMPQGYTKTSEIEGYVSSAIQHDGTIQTAAIQAANEAVQTALDDSERMTDIVDGVVSGRYLSKEDYADNDGKLKIAKIPSDFAKTSDLNVYAKTSSLVDFAKTSDLKDYTKTTELAKYAEKNDLFDGDKIKLAKIPTLNDDVMPGGYVKTSNLTAYTKTSELESKVMAIDGIVKTYALTSLANADLSNINTDNFNIKVKAVQGMAKTNDLTNFIKNDDLFEGNKIKVAKIPQLTDIQMPTGYVKTDDLEEYATTSDLKIYAKSSSLNEYAKTSSLKDYAQTSSLKYYATTSALSTYAKSDFSNVSNFDNKVLSVNGIAKSEDLNKYAQTSELINFAQTSELTKFAEKDDLFEGNQIKLAKIPQLTDNKMPLGYTKTSEIAGYVSSAIQHDGTIQTAAIQAANEAVQTALDDSQRMTDIVDGVVSGRYLSKEDYADTTGKLKIAKLPTLTDDVMPSGYVKTDRLVEYSKTSEIFDSNNLIKVNKIPTLTDSQIPVGYVKTDKLNEYTKTSSLINFTKTSDLLQYAKTSTLVDYTPLAELNKYTKTSDLFEGSLIKTSKLPTIPVENIPMEFAKTSSLAQYTKTSELASKVLAIDGLAKTSQLVSYQTTASMKDYTKTSALLEYQTTSGLTSKLKDYATTSALSTIDNKFINYQTTSGLETKLGAYQTTSGLTRKLKDYATTSALTSIDNKFVNYQTTSAMNKYQTTADLTTKLTAYTTTSGLETKLGAYQTTASMKDYTKTSVLLAYQTTSGLTSKLTAYQTTSGLKTAVEGFDTIVKTDALKSYQTTSELNNKLLAYQTTADLTTKLGAYQTTSGLNTKLKDYATTSALSTIDNKFINYQTTSDLNTKLTAYQTTAGLDTKLTAYQTTADLSTKLGAYQTTSGLVTKLKDYATTSALSTVDNKFTGYATTGALSNVDSKFVNYQTTAGLDTKLAGYTTTSGLETKLGAYQTTASMKDYTKTSALVAYQTTASMKDYTKTSALVAYQTTAGLDTKLTAYQTTSAMNKYQTTADLSTKLTGYATTGALSNVDNKFVNYQTTAGLDSKLAGYTTTSGLETKLGAYQTTASMKDYTKTSALSAYQTTAGLDTKLTAYQTTANMNKYQTTADLNTKLTGYATTGALNTVDNKFASYQTTSGLETKLGAYQTTAKMSAYQTTADLSTKLTGYATTGALNNVDSKFSGYATTGSLKNYAQTSSLTAYQTTADLSNKLAGYQTTANMKNYAQTSALKDYATTSALSTVDNKFAGYATTGALNTVDNKFANYQTTAGLDTKLAAYQTTANMKTYAQTSSLKDYATTSALSTVDNKFVGYQTTANMNKYQTTANMSGYATTGALNTVDNKFAGYATTGSLNNVDAKFVNYQTTAGMTSYQTTANMNKYQTTADLSTKLTGYATTGALNTVDNKFAGYATTSSLNNVDAKFANYQTTAGLDSKLSAYQTTANMKTYAQTSSLKDYATTSALNTVDNKFVNYQTTAGMSTYQTTAGLDTKLSAYQTTANMKTYAQTSSLKDYATTSALSTVDSKFADYQTTANMNKYQTTANMTGYATTGALNTVDNKFAGYATTSSLNNVDAKFANYQTTAGMKNYTQTSALASYQTTAGMNKYQTTANMTGYATTGALNTVDNKFAGYATTGALNTVDNKFAGYATTSSLNNVDAKFAGYATTGDLNTVDNKFSGYQTTAGMKRYQTTADMGAYQTTAGMKTYAQISSLKEYATTSALSTVDNKFVGYQTTAEMNRYQTTANMNKYQTTANMGAYQTTANMNKYQTTANLKTAVENIDTIAKTSALKAYQTTSELNTKLAAYQTTADLTTKLGAYQTTENMNKYQTTAGMSSYQSKSGMSAYQTTAGMSSYQSKSGMSAYQTTAGMSNYATMEALENVANDGTATANAILADTENQIQNSDGSLEILTTIFDECYIPEVAVKSLYAGEVSYGYCVLSDRYSNAYSANGLKDEDEDTIKSIIQNVDTEMQNHGPYANVKYVYLITNNDLIQNVVEYNPITIADVVKFNSDKTKYWYYDESSGKYIQCDRNTTFDVRVQYYTSNVDEYLGAFDCWWFDRTAENEDGAHKLQFSKFITTSNYDETGVPYNASAFKIDYYGNANGNMNSSDKFKDTYYHCVVSNDILVSSNVSDSQLKMYSTAYKVKMVTEFNDGTNYVPLLTGDTTGDGIGDINPSICNIYDVRTNRAADSIDPTGNTNYYFVVNDDYNANIYNGTAKNNIESTINWYNDNGCNRENYIYLFCYKDGPILDTHSNTVTAYGYFFRAVAYIAEEGICQPLNWRPVIPYSSEGHSFDYPAVVDLSGNSTTIGLPTGETVEFSPSMSTDDRVNALLYKQITRQISETTQQYIPGSEEILTIELDDKKLDYETVLSLDGSLLASVNFTESNRYDTAKTIVAKLDLTSAAFATGIIKFTSQYMQAIAAVAVCMGCAIMGNKYNDIYRKKVDYTQLDPTIVAQNCRNYQEICNNFGFNNSQTNEIIRIAASILRNMQFAIGLFLIGKSATFVDPKMSIRTLLKFIFYVQEVQEFESTVTNFLAEMARAITEPLITATLTNIGYKGYTAPLNQTICAKYGGKFKPAVPASYTTITTTRDVPEVVTRTITNQYFTNKSYTYTLNGTTYTSYVSDWFNNNTIVRFLVKNNVTRKVYEYRKWNKYTQTWSDLGVEEYVDYEGSAADTHIPTPTDSEQIERINNRALYNTSMEIVDLRNTVAQDVSNVNGNISVLVDQINRLTAIINSITGVSASERIKGLTIANNSLAISSENGPVVSGMSSAYGTPPSSITATSESVTINTNTRTIDRNEVKYKKSYAMTTIRS